MKAQEAINGPAVGNEHPRFCDLGATSEDSNVNGCGNFNHTVPVRSHARAQDPAPVGGLKSLNYNNQTATLAPASNWRPNTFRNNAESADGSVYIPFAYVQ